MTTTPAIPPGLNLAALHAALTSLAGYGDVAPEELEVMRVKGLAHDHVTIRGRGVLLRVPKQSQFAYSAADNLVYQAACFRRVSQSGHAPRLHAMIPPGPELPMGALLVDHIEGRPPRLPEDLPAFAATMAKVHALPVEPACRRAPLEDHRDPVAGIWEEVQGQAEFLSRSGISAESRAEIEEELAWAKHFAAEGRGGRTAPAPIAWC